MENINELHNITINETKEYSVGDLITRVSRKNKDNGNIDVYSISRYFKGFTKSEDTGVFKTYKKDKSGYNLIQKGEFGYNPNVIEHGTIGLFNDDKGLISGIYNIFKVNNDICLNEYFLYYLKSDYTQQKLLESSGGLIGIRSKFSFEDLSNFKIKVPSLETQQKIVNILDKMNTYCNDVNDGLLLEYNLLEKQFKFYLNKLLSLDGFDNNDIYIYKLEEIAKFSQGLQVDTNKQYNEKFNNMIQFLRIVDFVNENEEPRYIEIPDKKYIKEEGELIMIRYGSSAAGKVFLNKSGVIANNIFKINIGDNILNTYLCYFLNQGTIYNLLNKNGTSTMPSINFNKVGKLLIKFPKDLDYQQRIVDILDKFSQLKNQLKNEIELRNKQYKYYLNKLLTF